MPLPEKILTITVPLVVILFVVMIIVVKGLINDLKKGYYGK
jgi:hypothetical protein